MRRSMIAFGAVSLVAGSSGHAYEIGSGSVAKTAFNVHETITSLALACKQSGSIALCERDPAAILKVTRPTRHNGDLLSPVMAARWSDDPTRAIDTLSSRVSFGLLLNGECERVANRDVTPSRWGLSCFSHFGPMQVAHAQILRPAGSEGPVAGVELSRWQSDILDWASFAFVAAIDDGAGPTSLCDPTLRGWSVAVPAYLQLRRCDASNPYTVNRFFSWKCSFAMFGRCRDKSIGAADGRWRQAGGLGALLHVVQDSFSQAHVARLKPGENALMPASVFPSRVLCEPVTTVYDYEQQVSDHSLESEGHGNADKPPLIDWGCMAADRTIDGPITASARILDLVERGRVADAATKRALLDELRQYLRTRVFALRGGATTG